MLEAKMVSVIVPAYNCRNVIERCIKSIVNQTYKNLEIIIVNDGSKDDTLSVIKTLADNDDRIKIIDKENEGVSMARNDGVAMAKGDFIVLCDHDDVLPEHALYECAKAISEHPDCDCLYSDEDKLDMDGGSLFDPNFKPDFNQDLLTSVNYI